VKGIPNPSDCWGKLAYTIPGDRGSPITAWHPLIDHCADVAACCVVLLGLRPDGFTPTILNRRLARLGGQDVLDEVQVARLGVLAGLHDVGKCNRGFQNKRMGQQAPFTAGHVGEALVLLNGGSSDCEPWSTDLGNALAIDTLVSWAPGNAAVELLAAAICHHGHPVDVPIMDRRSIANQWQATADYDPMGTLTELQVATRTWLPMAWNDTGVLPISPAFQHGFCGLVQLADWLGSDTTLFPFREDTADAYWSLAWVRAVYAVAIVGMHGADYRRTLPPHPGFERVTTFPPRPMQTAVGASPLPLASSLTFIEEETGGGKTEAALWHFIRLFAHGAVDGMYFALPTRTAATQLYQRILVARDRCFPDPAGRPPVILAVPGYLGADGAEGKPLAHFDVHWHDDPEQATRHRRWAAESPKRYLAGTIVVGTIDQALLATLAVDHAHLRATCLLRHLLVVDEVHASDAYMTRLLAEVLVRTRAAGGHALLMSATLGACARDMFLAAWQTPAIGTDQAQAVAVPYPTLLIAGSAPQIVTRTDRARCITLTTTSADDVEGLVQRAIAAAQVGARVLIIRNTVSDCLATQAILERFAPAELLWRVPTSGGLVPVPHHARYVRDDRIFLDGQLEEVFGKHARRDRGCIACATQTVQQALDLDSDWMVTDLAPVDVLLQRLGRLHRHPRPRPPGHEQPFACVLMPGDALTHWLDHPRTGPHGWGTVYDDLRVLEATRRLVETGAWHIPADNRRLVEAATHPQALAQLDPCEPRWAKHGTAILGATLAKRDQARLVLMPWQVGFGSQKVCFPSGDLAVEIRTRLGDNDRRWELAEPVTSPFGHRFDAITLPARWCHDIPGDTPMTTVRTPEGVQLLIGRQVFCYDRLGLRPISNDAMIPRVGGGGNR